MDAKSETPEDETRVEARTFVGIFKGIKPFQGLGGAKWISSIHSISQLQVSWCCWAAAGYMGNRSQTHQREADWLHDTWEAHCPCLKIPKKSV